jgi:hypothetical protein
VFIREVILWPRARRSDFVIENSPWRQLQKTLSVLETRRAFSQCCQNEIKIMVISESRHPSHTGRPAAARHGGGGPASRRPGCHGIQCSENIMSSSRGWQSLGARGPRTGRRASDSTDWMAADHCEKSAFWPPAERSDGSLSYGWAASFCFKTEGNVGVVPFWGKRRHQPGTAKLLQRQSVL